MNADSAIEHLLSERGPSKTICPSEAARLMAQDDDWRLHMDDVHKAVDAMLAKGRIRLSWKGEPLALRDGPYRIAWADG